MPSKRQLANSAGKPSGPSRKISMSLSLYLNEKPLRFSPIHLIGFCLQCQRVVKIALRTASAGSIHRRRAMHKALVHGNAALSKSLQSDSASSGTAASQVAHALAIGRELTFNRWTFCLGSDNESDLLHNQLRSPHAIAPSLLGT